jgi:hypothetical protein
MTAPLFPWQLDGTIVDALFVVAGPILSSVNLTLDETCVTTIGDDG